MVVFFNLIMTDASYNIIIFHYNEIGIKSDKVRLRMENQLIRNAAAIYRKFGITYHEIIREFGRIYFYFSSDQMEKAIIASKYVIGLLYFSIALECSIDIESIAAMAIKLLTKDLGQNKNIRSFGISARRVKSYPMKSPEISKYVGEKMAAAFPSLKINLNKADFHLYIEIREKKAFLYKQQVEAYLQGLPLESTKMLLGQSFGRFSDLVSIIMMMKRGVFVQPIYFTFGRIGSDTQAKYREKLQYLTALLPSSLYCIEIPFESMMEKINRTALAKGISPCWLCFYVRQKILGELVDLINDGKIANEQISKSLELGEEVEINKIKKGHVKKKGFFKGVTIGLNETSENYCGTDLLSLSPLIQHQHLIFTPCITFDETMFDNYRKIFREMDQVKISGPQFDEIYSPNEHLCSLIDVHRNVMENFTGILDSLTGEQRMDYMKEISVERIYEEGLFHEDISNLLNEINIVEL